MTDANLNNQIEPEYEYIYQGEDANDLPLYYTIDEANVQDYQYLNNGGGEEGIFEDNCFFDEFGEPYVYESVINSTDNENETELISEETMSHIDETIHNVAHYSNSQMEIQPKKTGPTTKICEICGAFLKHPSKIAAHMRVHSGQKPYSCCYCNQKFTQRTPWRIHEKRHIGDTPFNCSYCPKSFPNASTCRAHENRVHLKKDREPPTKFINVKISSQATPVPQTDDESNYSDVLVITKTTRMKETSNTKEKEIKVYVCQICGLNLRHPSKVEQHMLTHAGYKFKPFQCSVCGLLLSSSSTFKVHYKRFHLAERPFVCRWNCSKSFATQANRNEHEKVVHSKIKRYQCAIGKCQKLFTRRLYLCNHLNNCHQDLDILPESEKGYRVVAIPFDTVDPDHFDIKSAKLTTDPEGITYLVDIIGPMGQTFSRNPNFIENEYLDYFEANNDNESETPPILEREKGLILKEAEITLTEEGEEIRDNLLLD